MYLTDPWIIRELRKRNNTSGTGNGTGSCDCDKNPLSVIPKNTNYAIGDICQLGEFHETALFLECIVAGNSGENIPNINTYDYFVNLNIITVGTVVFLRKFKTSCTIGHIPTPGFLWYKVGEIPNNKKCGAFDLSINYSSYSIYYLQAELTVLVNGGDNKILVEYISRKDDTLIYPEVALVQGEKIEIWVKNKFFGYNMGVTSMNYDDVFNVTLYNTFVGQVALPELPLLAHVDTANQTLVGNSKTYEIIPFENSASPTILNYHEMYSAAFGEYPTAKLITIDSFGNRRARSEQAEYVIVGGYVDSITFDLPLMESGVIKLTH